MKILVTGGASGLGKAIVELLAAQGHHLVITYHSSIDSANALKERLNVTTLQCDFHSKESIAKLQEQIESLDLDILINNALPKFDKKHFHKQTPQTFIDSFQHSVYPILCITKTAIRQFRKKKFGKIINILSSVIINKPPIGWSVYTANKAYLLSMNKTWATENAKYNITSNAISPAFMDTSLNLSLIHI